MPDAPLPAPFEAYVGAKPYLFASYAHVDGGVVFPELTYLRNQGYRIWYDEGIDPGNEWPEEVAKALANASLFLVFISSNAVKSRNVRNEVNFALNNKKPFIAIHLAETQLPPGLELRMGDIQAILKYRMSQESYSRKILKALPSEVRERIVHQAEPIPRTITAPGTTTIVRGLRPVHVFEPRDAYRDVAFASDGTIVLLADSAGYVSVWNRGTIEKLGLLQHEDAVHSVALHPSGGLLATASCVRGHEEGAIKYAERVCLWDIKQQRIVATGSHPGGIARVRFSTDGKLVATVGEFGTDRDGNVMLWRLDAANRTLLHRHTLDHKWPTDAAFLPGMIATVGSDNRIRLWQVDDGALSYQMFHDDEVLSCDSSPDGLWLATAGKDGTARVWSAKSGQQRFLFRHQDMVSQVAFSPDGRYVASAGFDAARVWSSASGHECFTASHGSGVPGSECGVLSLAFSPDSSMLLTGGCDDCAILWNIATGSPLARMYHDVYGGEVTACVFSSDGAWMLTGAGERMYLWNWQIARAEGMDAGSGA